MGILLAGLFYSYVAEVNITCIDGWKAHSHTTPSASTQLASLACRIPSANEITG
jgi:hypothetical protein